MDKAEFVADMLIDGRMSCETCPTLTDLVGKVKNGEMNRSEFVNIIRSHMEYQNDKVQDVI